MLAENAERLLGQLKPADKVLDVGAAACPFNRANWVLDITPYADRGFYRTFGGPASQGGSEERFTEDTWVVRDICDRTPWPFRDHEFDFAVCSHLLEDIRDPIWVCSELRRVAKRGYVEVPSREWETCRNLESRGIVGLSHHRWLIEIDGGALRFLMKHHVIHSHWRFSLPKSHARAMTPEQAVQWLWWEGELPAEEVVLAGVGEIERSLTDFVDRIRPYPQWRLSLARRQRRVRSLFDRGVGKARRMLDSQQPKRDPAG